MAIRQRGHALQIDVQLTVAGVAKRHRESWPLDYESASRREAEILLALRAGLDPSTVGTGKAPGDRPRLRLGEALEETWRMYWADAAVARTVRSNMKSALDFFGPDKPVEEITTRDIDRYLVHLRGEGLAPATIRSKCACLSKMFTHFHRRGNIPTKPHIDLPKPGQNMRDRVITHAEEAEILRLFRDVFDDALPRRADGHEGWRWADLIVVLMDTGARPSELRATAAGNLRGDLLDLKITKTNRPRTLPLTDRAREAFMRQAAAFPEAPFGWATPGALRHAWDWAKAAMDLSTDPGFIPYALRHTCATRLYDKTRDLLLVSRWLGHSSIQMTMRYAKLQPDDLSRARDLMQAGDVPVTRCRAA